MSFNGDVSGWNTSNVTNMEGVFSSCAVRIQWRCEWLGCESVTNMYSMFNSASDFNQDLSAWCVSNIETQPASFDTLTDSWSKISTRMGNMSIPRRILEKNFFVDTEERTGFGILFHPIIYIK